MPRKLKFKPTITRVKLNPEQAVLACTCYWSTVKRVGALLNRGSAEFVWQCWYTGARRSGLYRWCSGAGTYQGKAVTLADASS